MGLLIRYFNTLFTVLKNGADPIVAQRQLPILDTLLEPLSLVIELFESIFLLMERNLMIALIFIEILFNIVSRELARILEIFGGLFDSAH